MHGFSKKECFIRAKALVALGDQSSLRYACLEIRQCIEAISYAKMFNFKKVVPEEQFSEWNPKKIYSFLLEMEPNADKDYTLKIYKEGSNGAPNKLVFNEEHKTLTMNEIGKMYHKLGYYLHSPTIAKQPTYATDTLKLSETLKGYLIKLEGVVNTSFDSNFGIVCSFTCEGCNGTIYHNQATLEIGKKVSCWNECCGMVYVVENEDLFFKPLQFNLECQCGHKIYLNYNRLKDPCHLFCEICKARINIQKEWVFYQET